MSTRRGQPHINVAFDLTLHTITGHGVNGTDLADSFATGFATSATTTATRTALHATQTYQHLATAGQAALDTTALATTLTTDNALTQYATTGHLNPTQLTETALTTALTGALTTLRHPTTGTVAAVGPGKRVQPPKLPPKPRPAGAPPRSGVALQDIRKGIGNLWKHEGPDKPYGHTLQNHVGNDEAWLQQRLKAEPWQSEVSSFSDEAAAEHAVDATIAANPGQVADLLAGRRSWILIRTKLAAPEGIVARRGLPSVPGRVAVVKLKVLNGKVVLVTAYLEPA